VHEHAGWLCILPFRCAFDVYVQYFGPLWGDNSMWDGMGGDACYSIASLWLRRQLGPRPLTQCSSSCLLSCACQAFWFEEIKTTSFTSKKWFVHSRVPDKSRGALRDGEEEEAGVGGEQAESALSPLLFFHGGKSSVGEPLHLQALHSRLQAIAPSYLISKTKFVASVRETLYDVLSAAKTHMHLVAAKAAVREARLPGRGTSGRPPRVCSCSC
jgi:hypothetical protein